MNFYPGFTMIKRQRKNSYRHIVYKFDFTPAIYGRDWNGSAKIDPCPTLLTLFSFTLSRGTRVSPTDFWGWGIIRSSWRVVVHFVIMHNWFLSKVSSKERSDRYIVTVSYFQESLPQLRNRTKQGELFSCAVLHEMCNFKSPFPICNLQSWLSEWVKFNATSNTM